MYFTITKNKKVCGQIKLRKPSNFLFCFVIVCHLHPVLPHPRYSTFLILYLLYCSHVYICLHIYIYYWLDSAWERACSFLLPESLLLLYIRIPKFLNSTRSVHSMLPVWTLVLDKHMEGSSLWKTSSLALSIPQWPAVYGLWLRSLKLPPSILAYSLVYHCSGLVCIHVDGASYGEPFWHF